MVPLLIRLSPRRRSPHSLSLPIVVPFLSKTSPSFSLSGKLEGGLLVIDNTQENRGDAPAGGEGGIREDPERPGQTEGGRLKGGAGGGGRGARRRPSSIHPSIATAAGRAFTRKSTKLQLCGGGRDEDAHLAPVGTHLLSGGRLPLVHHDDLNNILAPIRPGVINPSPAYTQQVWQENAGPSIKTEESCEGGNEERMLSVCSG